SGGSGLLLRKYGQCQERMKKSSPSRR
ncbi:hypothetical protein D039_3427B, partial [Vibrio parahaemolyticus EKP-028]